MKQLFEPCPLLFADLGSFFSLGASYIEPFISRAVLDCQVVIHSATMEPPQYFAKNDSIAMDYSKDIDLDVREVDNASSIDLAAATSTVLDSQHMARLGLQQTFIVSLYSSTHNCNGRKTLTTCRGNSSQQRPLSF